MDLRTIPNATCNILDGDTAHSWKTFEHTADNSETAPGTLKKNNIIVAV